MPDLKSALLGAGLISERQFCEAQAAEQLEADARQSKALKKSLEHEKRFGILHNTSSPKQFARQAKRLLISDPDLIQRIVDLAYSRALQKIAGGAGIIKILLQVRNTFKYHPHLTKEEKQVFVQQFLSVLFD